MEKDVRSYIKYIFSLILFGTNGIVASHILLDSYQIVFLRSLIGSIFLIIVFIFSKSKLHVLENKLHFLYLAISGISMGAGWMFLYEAYIQIGVSLSALVGCCGPVIVIMLSNLIFKEKIAVSKVVGFLVVIAGMYFVNMESLQIAGFSVGMLCGIMSAVMYAILVIFNKKAKSITGLENSMFQLIFCFLTVAIFVMIKGGIKMEALIDNIVPVLVLGVINTGIGCYIYFSIIQKLSVGTVAICGYIEPLAALIFSAIFLNERLSFIQMVGAVCILGGALFAELSKSKQI